MLPKLSKIFLSFFLLFILICIIPFNNFIIVDASSIIYTTGFEDGTIGNSYLNAWISTDWNNLPPGNILDFNVSNIATHSGTRDFRLYTNSGLYPIGYWNLTYSGVITNFSFWLNPVIVQMNLDIYFNDTSANKSIVQLSLTKTSHQLLFYDYIGLPHILQAGVTSGSGYYHIWFTMSANDTIYYSCNTANSTASTPRNIVDIPHIDSIVFCTNSQSAVSTFYLDDLSLNADSSFVGGTYGDVSTYSSECIGYGTYPPSPPGGYFLMDDMYIEYEYDTYMSGTIYALDVPISLEQYNTDNFGVTGKDNYYLFLNGFALGNPTYAIPSGSNYILRWINFAVTLTNEKPLIVVESASVTIKYGDAYRWVGLGIGYEGYVKTHDSFDSANDKEFNGNSAPFGMSFCMYYISSPVSSPFLNDFIYTYGNKTSFEVYNSIPLNIGLKQYIPNTYVKYCRLVGGAYQLYSNSYMSSSQLLYGSFSFNPSFSAENLGTFRAYINRSGVNVTYCQFDIIPRTDISENYGCLYTQPNPSIKGASFKIIYKFNSTYWSLLPAGIIIDNDNNQENGYLTIAKNNIKTNGSVDILDSWGYNLLYITLFIYDNSTSQYIFANYPHFIGSLGDAKLWVQHDEYILLDKDTNVKVFVMWINPYQNGNVKLFVENKEMGNQLWLVDNPSYNGMQFYYAFHTGYYTVKLVLNDNIILASDTFIVKAESESSDSTNSIINYLKPYYLFIGIGLTVFLTLIPMIVGFTLAKKTSIGEMNIPNLVYVAFFLMGIIISIVLGFFEIWVIFFVLFALVLIFAITWLQNSKSGG